jgi:hypothetical protein
MGAGGAVHGRIMDHDHMSVGREFGIELDRISAMLQSQFKSGQRVFRRVR